VRLNRHFFIWVALTISAAYFNIYFCCCAIFPPVDSVLQMALHHFRPLSWIVTYMLACCVFTIAEWNLLWNTFWGKPAPECFVKVSAHSPNLRTLEMAIQKMNYVYLKLPNDDLFPCGLHRILITETYTKNCVNRIDSTPKCRSQNVVSPWHIQQL